jgi:hypothetical protein
VRRAGATLQQDDFPSDRLTAEAVLAAGEGVLFDGLVLEDLSKARLAEMRVYLPPSVIQEGEVMGRGSARRRSFDV